MYKLLKKIALISFLVLMLILPANSKTCIYTENGYFGLRDDGNTIITKPKYKKLVRLGDSAWIMQDGVKFGIIQNDGNIIVKPVYNQAERVLGKYAKLKKGDKYGIFDENGFEILPAEYSSIDLIYGGMFVTCKNYLYGLTDLNGQMVLDNIFDDIYTPQKNKLIIIYQGQELSVEKKSTSGIAEPFDIQAIYENVNIISSNDSDFNPIVSTGYYGIAFTDYILKLFASISPAYEETIDELVYSQGADTVNVLMKFTWLPKFPFVYAKKYYKNIMEPYNGPLGNVKKNLKNYE